MKEFKIINIGEGTDSRFGSIVVVQANPIMDNGYGKSFVTHLCSDTVTFFFPATNQFIIDELLRIANGGGLWTPDLEDEFMEEKIFDEVVGKRKVIYRHISFFDFSINRNYNINSGQRVQLIPDIQYKVNTFLEQYYRNGWYEMYSFADYVESLAEEDENTHFWQYLFGTYQFNGYSPYELPSDFYEAYVDFLDKCNEKA